MHKKSRQISTQKASKNSIFYTIQRISHQFFLDFSIFFNHYRHLFTICSHFWCTIYLHIIINEGNLQ